MVSSQQVAVDDTPTPLNADLGAPGATTLILSADADVYLGGPDVDTSTGFLLPADALPLTVTIPGRRVPTDVLYAVAETSANVYVLQV